METRDYLLQRSTERQKEISEAEKLKDLYLLVSVLFVIIIVVLMIIIKGVGLI